MEWGRIRNFNIRFSRASSIALVLAFSALLAGCPTNNGSRAPAANQKSTVGGLPGLGGGILPSGSTLYAITLTNAGPSISGTNGTTLDLYGQNGEIGSYCRDLDDCQCRLRFTEPSSGGATDIPVTTDYVENDLVRCSYDQVPATVSSFSVSITVVAGGLSSNEITLNFPRTDVSKDPSVPENYARVVRYQCKDVIGSAPTNFYDGLLDPQAWNMSLSFNLYTTSLGRDYGGGVGDATRSFECPLVPTDETVVKYSMDRYWPDYASQGLSTADIAGPYGHDLNCDEAMSITNNRCPGAPGSLFTGTDLVTMGVGAGSLLEYNLRGAQFGATDTSGAFNTQTTVDQITNTSTNGIDEDEPYDMALYSKAPLSGYDNVIYPVEVDKGAKTSLGNPNGSSCATGSDSSTCTCVTGKETGCRKYNINRHDFYVASFYDNTFRFPFCAHKSVGGATGRNNLTAGIDCRFDPTQTPALIGDDVLGYVALPNSSGQCPTVDKPAGKKWGLLWKFRHVFDQRKLITIANPDDIGDLFCTATRHECKGTSAAEACDSNDGTCLAADQTGVQYCRSTVSVASSSWKMGVVENYSNDGYRFGNCLDIPAIAEGDQGWCSNTDGSAPFRIGGQGPDAVAFSTGSALKWHYDTGTQAGSGCRDPMQLYFQGSTWTSAAIGTWIWGLFNDNNECEDWQSAAAIASGWDLTSAAVINSADARTFDWQGFPFIAGNYTRNLADAPETRRGVGFGGNYCNPALPGSRWSAQTQTNWTWTNGTSSLDDTGDTSPGWQDGVDVWLIGNGNRRACIEADVSASYTGAGELNNVTGFLYNPYARYRAGATALASPGSGGVNNENSFLFRLPGSADSQGFPGLVSNFPKTIKNWFDFVGIGCNGACDNSSAANAYPNMKDWVAGRTYQTGYPLTGEPGVDFNFANVLSNAWRSGPHSDTTSWGGYGIFSFGLADIDGIGKEDIVYVVSPEGITLNEMRSNQSVYLQYRPLRYIRGTAVEYDLVTDSDSGDNPYYRLPAFPVCVLQDDGTDGV